MIEIVGINVVASRTANVRRNHNGRVIKSRQHFIEPAIGENIWIKINDLFCSCVEKALYDKGLDPGGSLCNVVFEDELIEVRKRQIVRVYGMEARFPEPVGQFMILVIQKHDGKLCFRMAFL